MSGSQRQSIRWRGIPTATENSHVAEANDETTGANRSDGSLPDCTCFPHYTAIKSLSDPAEQKAKENQERQLLYTVCTRAREKLYLSWSPSTERSKFLTNTKQG